MSKYVWPSIFRLMNLDMYIRITLKWEEDAKREAFMEWALKYDIPSEEPEQVVARFKKSKVWRTLNADA